MYHPCPLQRLTDVSLIFVIVGQGSRTPFHKQKKECTIALWKKKNPVIFSIYKDGYLTTLIVHERRIRTSLLPLLNKMSRKDQTKVDKKKDREKKTSNQISKKNPNNEKTLQCFVFVKSPFVSVAAARVDKKKIKYKGK
jgi:hypothetical protein